MLYGLPPDEANLNEIRQILTRETQLERLGNGNLREDDLAFLCCAQLFSKGHLEDVMLIWHAKTSGFDLGTYLDVQLLCGPGLEKTKQFLAEHNSDEAKLALNYIQECERSGDFDDWAPSDQTETYRTYFGIA